MFEGLELYPAAEAAAVAAVWFPEADSVAVTADCDANQTAAAARAQR